MITNTQASISVTNTVEINRIKSQPAVNATQDGIITPNKSVGSEPQKTNVVTSVIKNESVHTDEKESKGDVEQNALLKAIDTVSAFMNQPIKNVNFLVDDSSGKTVIRVVDAKNDDLIRQFPSEKIIEMAGKIKGLQQEISEKTGMLIDSKV